MGPDFELKKQYHHMHATYTPAYIIVEKSIHNALPSENDHNKPLAY